MYADVELLACGQVVMADPKDRDKDVVVFLGTEHQIADAEEAGQRLAVIALHRVNGDRALHRVLPEQFRNLWHQLGEQVGSLTLMQVKLQRGVFEEPSLGINCMQNRSIAEAAAGLSSSTSIQSAGNTHLLLRAQAAKRAEGTARSAAATEARQVRDKARRLSNMRMAPKSVVMSEAQRRMVQSVLRGQGNTSGACASSTAAFGTEEGEGACQPTVRPSVSRISAARIASPVKS